MGVAGYAVFGWGFYFPLYALGLTMFIYRSAGCSHRIARGTITSFALASQMPGNNQEQHLLFNNNILRDIIIGAFQERLQLMLVVRIAPVCYENK